MEKLMEMFMKLIEVMKSNSPKAVPNGTGGTHKTPLQNAHIADSSIVTWETSCAHVKHYQSDFCDSCKEDRQTQSFSGVGYQHQIAEAEHAIQTIMYMARLFMIHAALH
jgi:hypothetical protein